MLRAVVNFAIRNGTTASRRREKQRKSIPEWAYRSRRSTKSRSFSAHDYRRLPRSASNGLILTADQWRPWPSVVHNPNRADQPNLVLRLNRKWFGPHDPKRTPRHRDNGQTAL